LTDFKWDYLIAGAGISGTLCALRLIQEKPDAKILMLEKEPRVGGRLRVSDQNHSHGFGLHKLHPELKELLLDVVESHDGSNAKVHFTSKTPKIAMLAANRITEIDEEPITNKGFRSLGGAAAAKNWNEFNDNILESSDIEKPISQIWKTGKKSAGVIVMQHYGRLLGIPDFLSATTQVIRDRIETIESVQGDWDCFLTDIIEDLCKTENFNLMTSSQIMMATKNEDDTWHIISRSGEFTCKNLVVAQPPWSAQLWLKKEYWETGLLKILTKTTPSSLVTLTTRIDRKDKDFIVPFDCLMIPAEETQAIVENEHSIVFQVTLDFESSLQAPNVIKAVRKLKRAKKKLNLAFEEHCVLEGDHIALVPTAWAQPTSATHAPFFSGEFDLHSEKNKIFFVGDSYGDSFNGDKNCILSFNQFSKNLAKAHT